MDRSPQRTSPVFLGVVAVIGFAFLGSVASAWFGRDDWKPGRVTVPAQQAGPDHPVTILPAGEGPWVDSGATDEKGEAIRVACATCHDNREPNPAQNNGAALFAFHQGLNYQHGQLTCLSCHNPQDYNTLKRADGSRLEFAQSMQLCAQCHSQQHQSYQDGTHGGMQGYWDLSRGPRTRNSCIHCHDPHHPAYPAVMPVFPPKRVPGENPHPAHES